MWAVASCTNEDAVTTEAAATAAAEKRVIVLVGVEWVRVCVVRAFALPPLRCTLFLRKTTFTLPGLIFKKKMCSEAVKI